MAIYVYDKWLLLCADAWTDVEAQVFCGQLGHFTSQGAIATSYPQSGSSVLPYSMRCQGQEPYITDCITHYSQCAGGRDAGVVCQSEWYIFCMYSVVFGTEH